MRLQKNRFNASKKEEDEEQYKENMRLQNNRFNASKREDDDEQYKGNMRMQKKINRSRQRDENEAEYKEKIRMEKEKLRETERLNCGRIERLKKFRNALKYGAIFFCISCNQRMFENGVTTVTAKFKETGDSKTIGLYDDCVTEEDQDINGKKSSYICPTCT